MIFRQLLHKAQEELDQTPAVVLLGPRQVGKTTLAHEIVKDRNAIYLDLEDPRDLGQIEDIHAFVEAAGERLIILDEVQRLPTLFNSLRGIIDAKRRAGQRSGQFLLLGSASLELLQQVSESLAGRIAAIELQTISAQEYPGPLSELWLRGGFPDSLLADSDRRSMDWRINFISTYLERDIPQFGARVPAETLRRFWTMLAHQQGGLLNAANIASSLGVSGQSVARYLDLLVDLLLVRRLPPWHSNVGKRLVKSPKVYVRDSGIVHALLGLETTRSLLGHPVAGGSWEGMVIENIIGKLSPAVQSYFYRTSAGAEIDLLLENPEGRKWAIEIKRSSTPVASKGFHNACADIDAAEKFIVYPGERSYPTKHGVTVLPLTELLPKLTQLDPLGRTEEH